MRVMTLLGLALAGVVATGDAREQRMTTGAKTHCLGRYLIDLPSDAQVRDSYTFARADVKTHQGISEEQFEQRVSARETELKNMPHNDEASLFVGRREMAASQISLASWYSPASLLMYRYELFSYFPQERVLYTFEGKGNANERALSSAYDYQKTLAESVRFRAANEVPAEHGFCIDSGLIQRSRFNREEVTANIRLRDYPSVTLTFMSYVTGNPDRELLRRTLTIPPGYEEVAARMQTLRRGNRNLGQVKGQELLVRGDGEGKKAYEFLWESQGQADSLEYPFLSLQLSTTGESDAEGEVIDAPFGSNEEAIALWDTILGSLRLRPGAVGQ